MRPAMDLISKDIKVWKAPKIYIAALYCILLSLLIGYERGALL